MALFEKRTQVFNVQQIHIGDFDPTKPGCYDNVKTFTIEVKPKRYIFFELKSEIPVSIVFANSDNSSIYHKEDIKEFSYGPIPTNDNKEIGLILGVYPGDKAKVDLDVWMERS
ncbi:MAG: hypothetical protein KRP56_06805 [Candidatus Methanogranum gryphiswaldense]|nr:MAG: hypothetical protein KRP56_06805 [Candidatus Methanogranum sp. U3.2.1]